MCKSSDKLRELKSESEEENYYIKTEENLESNLKRPTVFKRNEEGEKSAA